MALENIIERVDRHAEGLLLAGQIEQVGVVVFNQPEKRNAMRLEMWEGVSAALDRFAQDPQIRVVIYAGAGGKAFMSGSDISQFAKHRSNAEANAEFRQASARGRDRMKQFAKPSIACIEGFCIGGGMVTAMDADLRIASADAVFAITAAKLGLAYELDATERLVSLIGPAQAKWVLYSAQRFSAQQALTMGFLNAVASGDVAAECLELARTIAENAPLSVQASKRNIDELQKPAQNRDLALLAELSRRCMDSTDYKEGRAAFAEKRRPSFTGA